MASARRRSFTWSHHASFEASPISASQARAFVTRHLVEHRLPYL